jgi:GT2 family glycosyltransferase
VQSRQYDRLVESGLLEKVRAEFDERYYLETYAGLIDPDVDPFIDFIEVGWKAGRNPSRDFDTLYYLGINHDVAQAGHHPFVHYVATGRAEGRQATGWTDEQVRETRMRVLAQARRNLDALPPDFVEHHATVQITLVMLSYERVDQTIAAIRSIQANVAIPFRLLVIDNGSSPQTQRQLHEAFSSDGRIRFVMRNDNLGCAGGRNFGVEQVDTEFTMLVDNDLEVMPGTVEHLLHRMECEPNAGATTAMVVLPDGKVQLCGGTYRRDSEVLFPVLFGSDEEFDSDFDLPKQCDWIAGGASLIRTDLLRNVPFDARMSYYEDNDWAPRITSDTQRWTLHPVRESLTIHHTNPVQFDPGLSKEDIRRSRLRRVANLAILYDKHGFIHGDVFNFLPELGSYDLPISIESAKRLFALIERHGPDGVADMWQAGDLGPMFKAIKAEVRRRKLAAGAPATVSRAKNVGTPRAVRATPRLIRVVSRLRMSIGRLRRMFFSRGK